VALVLCPGRDDLRPCLQDSRRPAASCTQILTSKVDSDASFVDLATEEHSWADLIGVGHDACRQRHGA
jgi:hypothetical protein